MNHLKISILTAATLCSASALAGDPSAKFNATYSNSPSLSASSVASCDTAGAGDCNGDRDSLSGHTLTRMKVPQDKELLVGVSAEIGLMTFGAVKGKNGGSATTVADAEAFVSLEACPVEGGDCVDAQPSSVKLSKRVQELSAKLGGVIKECEDFTGGEDENGLFPDDEGYIDTPDGKIDISVECTVNDEEIALALTTTAAHHYNFVFPNMNQGTYDITATFTTEAEADVHLCDYNYTGATYTTQDCDDDGYAAGTAEAWSVINKLMVTVQQVRAAKNGIIDAGDISP